MCDYWISRAIRICGSQKELARRMGVKPDKVSYLLNEAKKISLEDALLIEQATGGAVAHYHLTERLQSKIKRKLQESSEINRTLHISERIALGINYEKDLGRRKGMRTDLKLSENFPQVKGRTEEIAAKYSGFNNYKTYHQAKQVVKWGIPELIEAMDRKHIAIAVAVKLAKLPKEEQRSILQLDHKVIIERIKQISKNKHSSDLLSNKDDLKHLWTVSLQWCFHLLNLMEQRKNGENTNS